MTATRPHNREAERGLVGAVLVSPHLLAEEAIRKVSPDSFHEVRLGTIWRAVLDLAGEGVHVSDETAALRLGGGDGVSADDLALLVAEVGSTLAAPECARVVRRDSLRRQVMDRASRLYRDAMKAEDPEGLLSHLAREVAASPRTSKVGPAFLSADDILSREWPEPVWAVPGLLPAGLTILGGAPKVGKSWLALQVAQAVAAGGVALGQRPQQRPILYLALEDPPRRLQDRMRRQHWIPGLRADFLPVGGYHETIGDLRNGGGERLARAIEERGYGLVAIDTLSRAFAGDQMDPDVMTRALEPAQVIAHRTNCALVVVDHHRKGHGETPNAIADILGSTAKGAMADSIWGLYREPGKAGARLHVTGRDLEDRTLALHFDTVSGCWQLDGEAGAAAPTDRQAEVLDALQGLGPSRLKDIVAAIGQDRGNTYKRLQDLVALGFVSREGETYKRADHQR